MIRNRSVRVLGAAAAVAAVALAALRRPGQTRRVRHDGRGRAHASCQRRHPAGGTVHIIDYSINSDGPYLRAILTGAIGDYGPAVTVYPDGRVDPQHTSQMRLSLTHGSFRLGIAALDKQIVKAYSHWPADRATCSGSISFTISAPVVPGSGTGMYAGISGRFSMTVTIDEVDVKPVCDGTSRFLSQVILMPAPEPSPSDDRRQDAMTATARQVTARVLGAYPGRVLRDRA